MNTSLNMIALLLEGEVVAGDPGLIITSSIPSPRPSPVTSLSWEIRAMPPL